MLLQHTRTFDIEKEERTTEKVFSGRPKHLAHIRNDQTSAEAFDFASAKTVFNAGERD